MNDTTATIQCRNGGTAHTHSSVIESKRCFGLIPAPAPASAFVHSSGASSLPAYSSAPEPPTDRQLKYVEDLGGKACRTAAKYLSKRQVSALIDELKYGPKEDTVTATAPAPTPSPRCNDCGHRGGFHLEGCSYGPRPPAPKVKVKDPKVAMLEALLPSIPEGMYAVREYEGGHIDFIRLSKPKNNKWKGSLKIQTLHGGFGDGKYQTRAALWLGSGTLWVGHQPVIPMLLLLATDHMSASLLYARESRRCMRCNAVLTDERSRHYGIGPECEKIRPDVIERVDELEALAAL